ncbi:MAG: dehydrogenase, quinone family protein [Chlamydiales bacterium]|jgi:NAD(P)H dehydrogenase (quinone)|nr:dehydrogenase, quinone family protein [Chlamydiales bacterium]
MKILIIYTHPNPKSFNHAILETAQQTLSAMGHEVHIRDLYAMQFQPVLSATDFISLRQGVTPPDIAEEQKWISWANALIFIYPIWWSDRPAILKGWIDRVFHYGFAFEMTSQGLTGMLQHKVLIFQTAGADQKSYQESGSERVVHSTMKEGTLQFCGIQDIMCKTFYSVVSTTDAIRKEMLEELKYILAQQLR